MGKNRVKMTVSPEVKKIIMVDCKNSFLEHHPEFKGIHITENFMLTKIAEVYLKLD